MRAFLVLVAQWVAIFLLIAAIMLWAIPGYLRWAIWG